jgi:hypothetical protein
MSRMNSLSPTGSPGIIGFLTSIVMSVINRCNKAHMSDRSFHLFGVGRPRLLLRANRLTCETFIVKVLIFTFGLTLPLYKKEYTM